MISSNERSLFEAAARKVRETLPSLDGADPEEIMKKLDKAVKAVSRGAIYVGSVAEHEGYIINLTMLRPEQGDLLAGSVYWPNQGRGMNLQQYRL